MSYIDPEAKKYLISENKLRELIMANAILQALEAGGVDNWGWYDESRSDYLKDYQQENNKNEDFDFYDLASEIIEQEYQEV